MSSPRPPGEFEKALERCIVEFKTYPNITDMEAEVMAWCLQSPRFWPTHFQREYNLTKEQSRALLSSGAEKYRAGGGKEHWQG